MSSATPKTSPTPPTASSHACQRAKITGVTLKDIRAMAATAAKKKGYTRAQIKITLAHTDESTIDGYIRERDILFSEIVLTLPKIGK